MVIGIDLGGMSAKAAVLKENRIFGNTRVKTDASNPHGETAHALATLAFETARAAGVPFDEIEAIGIGSPGVIDSEHGIVVSWTNFFWKDVPLAELVSRETGKRVFVTNDANAAAVGEAKFGAGKKYTDSILITLGTGVGGGIILGGKLFEGYRSAGAEIGHTIIRQNGELCTCGRRGCFERYASASALVRYTAEKMRRTPDSLMWKFALSPEQADGKTAFSAAAEGDRAAKEVLSRYIAALGEGIVNFANLLRPQAVILGGGVSAAGEQLLKPLRRYVYPRLYVSEKFAPLEIVIAELGNDAGLYGAAGYALERIS